jgi:hypothetical protein
MDYNKQTFEGVIRQSIKAFKEGKLPEQTLKAMSDDGNSKEVKYTPEYFDELEAQILKEKEKLNKKEKKESKKKKPLKMSEGGTPEEQSTGQKVGIAIADGMKAYGDGVQKAYDGELDEDKFRTSEPPRRR